VLTINSTRTIAVVTVARSDYGIYLPILRRIVQDPDLRLYLIAGGMHLEHDFGHTVDLIEADGFKVSARVRMSLTSDAPLDIARSIGLGVKGYAEVFAEHRPDILVVLGDRFDMHAAALAALPFNIPVAHIHGGELSEGAIDDALRHSMTKLSHLHFATTESHGQRLIQMGEEPWRVQVCGAPSLDNLRAMRLLSLREVESRLGLPLPRRPLLITYHPVTREYEKTGDQVAALLKALEGRAEPLVFTMPNADTHGRMIREKLRSFVEQRAGAVLVENLGTPLYFSLMENAAAMVGNSSSGIIEAASFGLPVLNIGNRQKGRECGENVIHVGYSETEIRGGLEKVTDPAFRRSLKGLEQPYGDGHASERIVKRLKCVELERLPTKPFFDAAVREPMAQPS